MYCNQLAGGPAPSNVQTASVIPTTQYGGVIVLGLVLLVTAGAVYMATK